MFFRRTMLCLLFASMLTAAQAQLDYRYWFDNNAAETTTGVANGIWNVDASGLREGFHVLRLMVSPSGQNNWSAPRTLFFVKAPAASDWQGMTYVASVDNRVVQTGTINSSNGNIALDIDLASVPNGFHSLNILLITKNGAATDFRNAYFWKLHTGGNHITRYEYWVNDGLNKQTVDVVSNENPFVFDGFLDLGEDVFTPHSYHFEIRNGKAYVFAKNTVTVRFYDADYQSTEASKSFIDYNVGGELTGSAIGQQGFVAVVPGEPQTVAEPAADAICWFQVFANEGDEVAVRVSRACQLEVLYVPTNGAQAKGQQRATDVSEAVVVYSTDNASQEGSFTAPQTGTYYIALHDMASQTGGNVTLTCNVTAPPTLPTAISNAVADDHEAVIYDLGGRELPAKPDKGIYIQQRKKVRSQP